MATTNNSQENKASTSEAQHLGYLTDSEESIISNDTDDGANHDPEKILAEHIGYDHNIYYLVKWKDCSVLRSSWERVRFCRDNPWILDRWFIEKQRQAEGKSKPLNFKVFREAVLKVEGLERERRRLRRLKRQFKESLAIVKN